MTSSKNSNETEFNPEDIQGRRQYSLPIINEYKLEDISVYIFNWKKVSQNSVELVKNIKKYTDDVTVINCDESFKFEDSVKTIQLDDSHYYGSQYEHAILDVKENKIFCAIVGDNISENNFEKIFMNAIEMFNKYKVGVYAPHDKRSYHKIITEMVEENVYHIENTDCGFWFINPEILKKIKKLNYGNLTPFGWGVDLVTIRESKRLGFIVIRDYRVETDQLDYTTNYDADRAANGQSLLIKEYETIISNI